MAILNMTAEEFREQLDTLLGEDWFETIAITRNGEQRIVVQPAEIFHAMHKADRRSVRVEDLSDAAKKALRDAKVAEPSRNSSDAAKDELA